MAQTFLGLAAVGVIAWKLSDSDKKMRTHHLARAQNMAKNQVSTGVLDPYVRDDYEHELLRYNEAFTAAQLEQLGYQLGDWDFEHGPPTETEHLLFDPSLWADNQPQPLPRNELFFQKIYV